MKNKVWGYVKYLLLGVITATALLWSLTVVPAVASTTTTVRHAKSFDFAQDRFISASPVEILKPVLCSPNYGGLMQVQDDEGKGLVLSLPFSVESRWTSVSDNTMGIAWQVPVPDKPEKEIRFGIQGGQFAPGDPGADTWFIYGWFGALEAIQQPYNVKYPEWGDRHNGIDFAGQEGIEVTSASNGTVIFAGKKIGNTVIVNAGNGYRITYGHLQDISVKREDKIKAGDLIGHLGNTGTINPHLHFQVDLIKKGSRTAINPLNLIENTDWSRVVIPNADANLFTTENQNPLTQPDFNW